MSLTCRSLCNELFCETDQESKQTSPKTLLQKCPIQKISWSAFSHISIKYRDLQSKFLYSVQIREIRTWKTPNTHTFHSVKPLKSCCRPFCKVLNLGAFDMLLDQQPYDLIVRQESNLFELRYIRKCLV